MTKIKTILFSLLAIAATHAQAEWKNVGQTTQGEFFMDSSQVKKIKNFTYSAWLLQNFNNQNALRQNVEPELIPLTQIKSKVSRVIVDCENAEFGTTETYFFNKIYGDGDIVHHNSRPLEMKQYPPESIGDGIITNVCAFAYTGETALERKANKRQNQKPPAPAPKNPADDSVFYRSFEEQKKSLGIKSTSS